MAAGSSEQKRKAYRLGFTAEWKAAAYLLFKGYGIVAMRYRTHGGEIDIIARKKDLIAFVEVKARRSVDQAIAAVGYAAQTRIRATSLHWLSRQKDASRLSLRYDVIAVLPRRLPVHIPDVF